MFHPLGKGTNETAAAAESVAGSERLNAPAREFRDLRRTYTRGLRLGIASLTTKMPLWRAAPKEAVMAQSTGASNLEFDIIAAMHELLEGNAALERYIEDAREEAHSEAETCFNELRESNKAYIEKLRNMLASELSVVGSKAA